jgi:hypothetical protein
VFSFVYPALAIEHEQLLSEIARLGDFREMRLAGTAIGARAVDVCAWLNAVEAMHFYRPFHGTESSGAAPKFEYFLPRLASMLTGSYTMPPVDATEAAAYDKERRRILDDVDGGLNIVAFA